MYVIYSEYETENNEEPSFWSSSGGGWVSNLAQADRQVKETGHLPDGEGVRRITLEEAELIVEVAGYGCHICCEWAKAVITREESFFCLCRNCLKAFELGRNSDSFEIVDIVQFVRNKKDDHSDIRNSP